MISKKNAAILAAVIPPCVLLIVLFRDKIIELKQHFPECVFHKETGYLCPACGNTRSITALMHGQLIDSAMYNPMPLVLVAFLLALYIELFACALGKNLVVIPRSYHFLAVILGCLIAYYLLRNFVSKITLCV